MFKKIATLLVFTFMSCSTDVTNPTPEPTLADQLQQKVDRISPKLLWCLDMPSFIHPDTHSLDCDLGDGIYDTGILLSEPFAFIDKRSDMMKSLNNSFSSTGQPFRSPAQVDKAQSNEFSRDQSIGLALAALGGHSEPLNRMLQWSSEHDDKLCLHPTDTRCNRTPLLNNTYDIVLGKDVSKTLDGVMFFSETSLLTKSATYEVTLKAMQLYIRIKMNVITHTHVSALQHLLEIQPNNLFLQYLQAKLISGDYKSVGTSLHQCMSNFEEPGNQAEFRDNYSCSSNFIGHRLIWLATIIINDLT